MGQQQLLLLVLGAMIVGMAVYGGARMMEARRQGSDRDLIINHMRTLVADANQYAAKPTYLGGGGGSYDGYQPITKLRSMNGVTIETTASGSWVTFLGVGSVIGEDGTSPVQVVVQYDLSQNAWYIDTLN